MTTSSPSTSPPRIGMVATVRNRRGIISSVRPYDGPDGRLHLVDVEYNDGESPLEESLLWEREPYARLLPPAALPNPLDTHPMQANDLLALMRACRWSARTPFIDPDGSGPIDRMPISSPFHGAVQVEDYQLVPLLKALRMPRVSLLLADDVGLGKTIEAGLILSELLLRRRVRRVLIMTPASLRVQWQEELWEKFSLNFDIVDRDSTLRLRRQMGLDANPWRSHSRVITSYHYLKQPDILEQFRVASHSEGNDAHLPWDLLIVDEAHNLTPSPFGEESDLTKMLRHVAPFFEHRLFLTATPHNGHTLSFTGLLEMLDPVRFSQTPELRPAERTRVQDVLVRRLKREINARSNPPKFCNRLPPHALVLDLSEGERQLYAAFNVFRAKIRSIIQKERRRRRLAGNFAVEILGKRLLSCPVAFGESWGRYKMGMREEDQVSDSEVLAARRAVEEETVDDREATSRTQAASSTVGAWLKPMAAALSPEMKAIDQALASLQIGDNHQPIVDQNPTADARFEALQELIVERLQKNGRWLDEERMVIFTEYKTTLDYLLRRLRDEIDDPQRVLSLFGGMDDGEREEIKRCFNDPNNPVRILIATDAASEGLNLQETARYLLHYDLPWNPARLEQRNGRLDRHGQPRDVEVWHYVSDQHEDLAFLNLVAHKVDEIREDIGAIGEVIDELTHRRLIEGAPLEEVRRDLEARIEAARKQVDLPRDDTTGAEIPEQEQDPAGDLEVISAELDFDPEALRTTLDSALALALGRPRITDPDADGRCQIVLPHPTDWRPVIDDTVRLPSQGDTPGALPGLTFSPENLVVKIGGRPVFRPRKDTLLLHLGHPMLQRALTSLTRQRFPGTGDEVSRWMVRRGEVPSGTDALLLLSVEELAVNELREPFHHWIRTMRLPVEAGELQAPLSHLPPRAIRPPDDSLTIDAIDTAQDLWLMVEGDVRNFIRDMTQRLTQQLRQQLDIDRQRALDNENERYQSRQGEVSALIESSTMARLEREINELNARKQQGTFFDEDQYLEAIERNIQLKEDELKRRQQHYEEIREQLARERERILQQLIPRRYAMRGDAQIMPVVLEIVLPGGAQ